MRNGGGRRPVGAATPRNARYARNLTSAATATAALVPATFVATTLIAALIATLIAAALVSTLIAGSTNRVQHMSLLFDSPQVRRGDCVQAPTAMTVPSRPEPARHSWCDRGD